MVGINILNPLAFLFAVIAVPILLLYLLRLQRREQRVPSTMLWQEALLDREANTLWQRLRPNLLLFLQLATLAFLVFALVRPYVNVAGGLTGRLVVLLDGSASMRATDVAPTRFDAAKAEVRNLIATLGAADEMMIILVDGSPRAISGISSERAELNAAIDNAQPSLASANWGAAISLGSAAANENATIVVISDGAQAEDLKLLNKAARYIPIGTSADNLSISNVSLRRTLRGNAAFVRVTNTGLSDDEALVSIHAGDQLVDARTLKIPAGQSAAFTVNDLSISVNNVRASIDKAGHNALPIDDVAYAVGANAALRRALLISRGNRFLEQALGSLPNLQVSRAISLSAAAGDKPYDLYVLDNNLALPSELPPRANVLVIGANDIFSVTGVFSNTGYVRTDQSPIVQNVSWRNVNIAAAYELQTPSWMRPVIEGQGGSLLYFGVNPDADALGQTLGRVVVLPFELRRSDLPLQLAFPILVANSVDWLAPNQGLNIPTSVKPGEVVALPNGSIVTLPDGTTSVAERGFANTNVPGLYGVKVGDTIGAFAVNFINSRESDITPNPMLQVGPPSSAPIPTATKIPQFSQREIWRWLAVLALVLLLIEWWIYQRGLPRFGRAEK